MEIIFAYDCFDVPLNGLGVYNNQKVWFQIDRQDYDGEFNFSQDIYENDNDNFSISTEVLPEVLPSEVLTEVLPSEILPESLPEVLPESLPEVLPESSTYNLDDLLLSSSDDSDEGDFDFISSEDDDFEDLPFEDNGYNYKIFKITDDDINLAEEIYFEACQKLNKPYEYNTFNLITNIDTVHKMPESEFKQIYESNGSELFDIKFRPLTKQAFHHEYKVDLYEYFGNKDLELITIINSRDISNYNKCILR